MTPTLPPTLIRNWIAINNMTDLSSLERLKACQDLRASLRTFESTLAEDARSTGATWQEIADTLEITRQAAHERFTS
jgi:hypothetical protein